MTRTPNRTAWLAVALLLVLAAGVLATVRFGDEERALNCAPDDVRWVDGGTGLIAVCAPGSPPGPVPVGQAGTVGLKVDLNRISESELAQLPGVGPGLARALVEARGRDGGFKTWDEVDAVPGVGPAKLQTLQDATDLRP